MGTGFGVDLGNTALGSPLASSGVAFCIVSNAISDANQMSLGAQRSCRQESQTAGPVEASVAAPLCVAGL